MAKGHTRRLTKKRLSIGKQPMYTIPIGPWQLIRPPNFDIPRTSNLRPGIVLNDDNYFSQDCLSDAGGDNRSQLISPTTLPPRWQPLFPALRPPPLFPIVHQPAPIMAQIPAYGIVSMPLVWSKLAPYFSGKVHDPIKEFLQEYEELADSNGLTRQQKVETIIRYVNPS